MKTTELKSTQDKVIDNLFDLKGAVMAFTSQLEAFKLKCESSATEKILDAIIISEGYKQMKSIAELDLSSKK